MGDFIEPGLSNFYRKKSEVYSSYCIESKDFIYAYF